MSSPKSGQQTVAEMSTNADGGAMRVAVVTGSGRPGSIGWAVANRVAQDGFRVVLTQHAGSSSSQLEPSPDRTMLRVDVTDPSSLEHLVQETLTWGGRIDAWVNCAGLNQERKSVEEITDREWSDILAVNLTSVFRSAQLLAPVFRSQGTGVLVNVSSRMGKVGEAGFAPYVASKFGVVGLTQVLAKEWAPIGVRVFAVCPGLIDTPMSQAFLRSEAERVDKSGEETLAELKSLIPLGRLGNPDEVANLIAFLVTDQASYMTGESINVSGGRWVH